MKYWSQYLLMENGAKNVLLNALTAQNNEKCGTTRTNPQKPPAAVLVLTYVDQQNLKKNSSIKKRITTAKLGRFPACFSNKGFAAKKKVGKHQSTLKTN